MAFYNIYELLISIYHYI